MAEQPDVPGIDVGAVTAWLVEHVEGAVAPFGFDVIAGGHSNLTYRVTGGDGRRFDLRRPPLGHVLASAHDMGREHRIISGLRDTAVPVAPALGFCDDDAVIGAPFYVMGFVDGHVVRDRDEAEAVLSPAAREQASRSLVDTMAAIHAVDLEVASLADLVDEVHDALAAQIPEQGPATIVHGDYRLDNTMVSGDGDVMAVLDWEICTLGDPLADVGLLSVYWTGPGDEPSAWGAGSTSAPGFWDRAQLPERYAEVSGRDVSGLDFYVAFGYWKLACILEGVYARYLGGALGERRPEELAHFVTQVDGAAVMAAEHLEGRAASGARRG